jgi:spore maturation protein CgeB
MRILIYQWKAYGIHDLINVLKLMGHDVDTLNYNFSDYEQDEKFTNVLTNRLQHDKYDAVVSFNFFQVVSNTCNRCNVKYISWIVDSPTLNLYSNSVFNKCNYIFIFDKALYQSIKNMGVEHSYYLPLAVNVSRLDEIIITEEDINNYKSDISFVGSLYDKKISYDALVNLPEYYKGYFDGIIRAQLNVYGYNFLEEILTKEILEVLNKYVYLKLNDNFIGQAKMIYANTFLGVKVTSMERHLILNLLSKEYDVNLYTNSNTDSLPNINNKGYIDYYMIMPKVFRLSKININITLKTIKTGIPLRVFDVMGAGGFLLTNYQEDLLEYFEDGTDLVIYESVADLQNKVKYYLEHEDERQQIAYNGYNKVKELHNYNVRLNDIFSTVLM